MTADRDLSHTGSRGRRVLTAGALVGGVLAVVLLLSGGALPRFITAALAWFKG